MNRIAVLAALMAPFFCAPAFSQKPGFVFEFATATPGEFEGTSGDVIGPFEVLVAIRPQRLEGPDGPQGWSVAVTHDPLIELIQVTIDGTNAGDLYDRKNGFLKIDIIDPDQNGGKRGYVAATVLTLAEDPIFLPPDRLSTIVSATYWGEHPQVEEVTENILMFEFTDGLVGSAEPVVNNVSYRQGSYFPDYLPLQRILRTNPSCNSRLTLDLEAPGSVLEDESQVLRLDLAAGEDLVIDSTVMLQTDLEGPEGPEGWSISVQHDQPFFELQDATTEGTDVEILSDVDHRILKTQISDENDHWGFISAVVLSTIEPRTLPPTGKFSIARARYRLAAPHDEPGEIVATPIRFQDGIKIGNEPVQNIFTVDGKTEVPCRTRPLRVEVNVVQGKIFQRGDANNTGRITLADGIWIVRGLFFGGPSSACPAASDTNADHAVNQTDAIYLLEYLFLDGNPIPAPFPGCAPSPDIQDPLSCDEDGVNCP